TGSGAGSAGTTVPANSATGEYTAGTTPQNVSALQSQGTLVGPPIGLPPAGNCNQTAMNASPATAQRAANQPSESFSCAYIGQNVVTQVAYKSTISGN